MKHLRLTHDLSSITYNPSPITHNLSYYIHKLTLPFLSLFISVIFSLCLVNSTATAGWDITTVDSAGAPDLFNTSLAFDASGNPAISYTDDDNSDLKFARFNGVSWDITTVDSAGIVGQSNSLAFDASGNPAISYLNVTIIFDFDIKFARFNGVTWDITTVDSAGDGTGETSLAFDASGNPAISYFDTTFDITNFEFDLKFARFVPEICDNGVDADTNFFRKSVIKFNKDKAKLQLCGTSDLCSALPGDVVIEFSDCAPRTISVSERKSGVFRGSEDGNRIKINCNTGKVKIRLRNIDSSCVTANDDVEARVSAGSECISAKGTFTVKSAKKWVYKGGNSCP